jgi:hypothetical protein
MNTPLNRTLLAFGLGLVLNSATAQIRCNTHVWFATEAPLPAELGIFQDSHSPEIKMTLSTARGIETAVLTSFRSRSAEDILDVHDEAFPALDFLAVEPSSIQRATAHDSSVGTLLSFFGKNGQHWRAFLYGRQIAQCL